MKNNMKKILKIIFIGLLCLPFFVSADTVATWVDKSPGDGIIYPKLINGSYPSVSAPYVTATSTTISSTFAGGIDVTKGLDENGDADVFDITVPLGGTTYAERISGYYTDTHVLDGEYKTTNASISNFFGWEDSSLFSPIASGKSMWSFGAAPVIGGSQNISNVYGFLSSPFTSGVLAPYSGTADNVDLFEALSTWNSGTATNYSLFHGSINSIGASVANLYGLRIGDLTQGTLTNFAIKTGLGKVSFGDSVGISSTTPGTSLSIGNTGANTINISPTATSTFGSGLNIRTGCFSINGVCSGAGTVSSVAMTVPTFLSVAGSPVTTSGTLAVSLSGTALPVANGGTGATTFGQGWIFTPGGTTALAASTSPTVDHITATSTTLYNRLPNIKSGDSVTAKLNIESTAGNGTTDAINLNVGNNGATKAVTVAHSGTAVRVGVSNIAPATVLDIGTPNDGTDKIVTINFDSGETAGVYFGDNFNSWTTLFGGDEIIKAYNGLKIMGSSNNLGGTDPWFTLSNYTNAADFAVKLNGNIGFGTTTPVLRVDVNGAMLLEPTTTPSNIYKGMVWHDSTQNQLTYTNGNTFYQGGNLYTATADKTITSTSPTTAFSSTKIGVTTIAANTLKVGQKFTIWGAGYYSTPLGNTSTVTIATSFGGTALSTVTTGIFPASATNLPFDFNLSCTVRSIGASGTLVCDGTFNYSTALTAVAKTSNSLSTVGTITVDTTVAAALDVKVNWSAVTTQTATVQESKIDFQ